jgi:Ser/Thr protein kinase RdoA (MazF antagonist)
VSPVIDEAPSARALRELAGRAIALWDVEVAATRFISARENAVYRIDATNGRSYALRIHRPGYHTLAELESENEWTTALSDAGIDAPRPVPTRDGSAYATLPFGDGETRHVGVIEWIDAESLEEVLERDDRDPLPLFRELGVLLARLHDQASSWHPPPGFARHALDAVGLIGDEPWWGQFWDVPELSAAERSLVLAARGAIDRVLAAYGTEPQTYGLIHADLLPQNVLVLGDRMAAIDFDDAALGWHQYDIAVALHDFEDGEHAGAFQEALIAGYRSIRAFDDEALAMLPVFQLVRNLVEIGWFHSRMLDAAGHVTESRGAAITREGTIRPRMEAVIAQCAVVLPDLRW